jgi:hypothetical protein
LRWRFGRRYRRRARRRALVGKSAPRVRLRASGDPDKEGAFERLIRIARHLTERDRAIAIALYEHQLLTTDQLTLLFFSSKRRTQDRLRFLYDQRVVDRFYPPRPFGFGKPQAHWLLDEAGAILVAASLGVERKRLGWQRRDDWGSHPQLMHRLEANRLFTDLIGATLKEGSARRSRRGRWASASGGAAAAPTRGWIPQRFTKLPFPTAASSSRPQSVRSSVISSGTAAQRRTLV